MPYTFTESGELRILLAYSRKQTLKLQHGLTILGDPPRLLRSLHRAPSLRSSAPPPQPTHPFSVGRRSASRSGYNQSPPHSSKVLQRSIQIQGLVVGHMSKAGRA